MLVSVNLPGINPIETGRATALHFKPMATSLWSRLFGPKATAPKEEEIDTLRMTFLEEFDSLPAPPLYASSTTGAVFTRLDHDDTASNSTLPPSSDCLHAGDAAMIEKLEMQRAITGTYDLDVHTESDLLRWQRNIMMEYFAAGSSPRLDAIERILLQLRIGTWLTPHEARNKLVGQLWWAHALRFHRKTAHCPSRNGVVHPDTPVELAQWASEQIRSEVIDTLSPRQIGELRRLGILRASKDWDGDSHRLGTNGTFGGQRRAGARR